MFFLRIFGLPLASLGMTKECIVSFAGDETETSRIRNRLADIRPTDTQAKLKPIIKCLSV